MAITMENFDLSHPNCSAMGIWKTPKEALIEKPVINIRQPAIKTGVKRLDFWAEVLNSRGQIVA